MEQTTTGSQPTNKKEVDSTSSKELYVKADLKADELDLKYSAGDVSLNVKGKKISVALTHKRSTRSSSGGSGEKKPPHQ